jgi:cation transport protein ChaC
MVQRISRHDVPHYLPQLWQREMPYPAYDPRWLRVHTDQGPVRALGFTLARHSPHHTGELSSDTYHHIFKHASGLFGTTLDYAQQTFDQLQSLGITDHALGRLLQLADAPTPQAPPRILNQ